LWRQKPNIASKTDWKKSIIQRIVKLLMVESGSG
jgi:hypothetical protein